AIEKDGYHVLSNEEYIDMNLDDDEGENAEGNADDQTQTDNNDNPNEESDEGEKTGEEDDDGDSDDEDNSESDETTTYTLDIEEGMTSSSISSSLEENNIIDDAQSFNEYLQEEGYDEYVQLGSFE